MPIIRLIDCVPNSYTASLKGSFVVAAVVAFVKLDTLQGPSPCYPTVASAVVAVAFAASLSTGAVCRNPFRCCPLAYWIGRCLLRLHQEYYLNPLRQEFAAEYPFIFLCLNKNNHHLTIG